MRHRSLSGILLLPLLVTALFVQPSLSDENGPNGEAQPQPVLLPGFALVPGGTLNPGCSRTDYKVRTGGSEFLERVFMYEQWGGAGTVLLPPYYLGKFEVTNAQWKLFLDSLYRHDYTTVGQETLEDISAKFVQKLNGDPDSSEWRAIYGLNAPAIFEALEKAEAAEQQRVLAADEVRATFWKATWTLADPAPGNEAGIEKVHLPAGIKLTLYSHATPVHWYGWCKLSGLRVGQEYCDITKAPVEAFILPEGEFWAELKLPFKNFAAHPIRYISTIEALEFTEWAGVQLPSEYEWERAARDSRENTVQFPGNANWDRNAQVLILAWQGNPACAKGPLPVDDPGVVRSDSPFGARHMLGNVYELTRTFYDKHPDVVPVLPGQGLFNYALVAKGGAWGDGWQTLAISTRTGTLGTNCDLDLRYGNRVDTLGFRVVRHERPGYDLMLHSLRRISYNPGRGAWNEPYPHAFAMPNLVGADRIHLRSSEAPYEYFQQKATGIAFVPLWMTASLTQATKNKQDDDWKRGKSDGRTDILLGALRSDLPIRCGIRLTEQEANALKEERIAFEKAVLEAKRKKPKKGEPPVVLPPQPLAPDEMEKATAKNESGAGLWREGTLPPGEWQVVYWYGFLGLRNKGGLIEGILPMDAKTGKRQNGAPVPATLAPVAGQKDSLLLTFSLEEDNDPKKPQIPPDVSQSEFWALCETINPKWTGWPGRRSGKYSWEFAVILPFVKDSLQNLTPSWPAAPAPGKK